MTTTTNDIWVFGDYRNYFQNRVTLQLLARANDLAAQMNGQVCAVVFGHGVDEYVREYIAHGAQRVYVADHPLFAQYAIESYATTMVNLARAYQPEIILVGATCFGKDFAPRVAKRLRTGLTADCIQIEIDDQGRFIQTAPGFGGNLLARIHTPESRPQMATVRPGIFQELPHNNDLRAEIVTVSPPDDMPVERVRLVRSERRPPQEQGLETAPVVVCGGRGMGSKLKFKKLFDLARLLNAEVGATRPVVYSKWAEHDCLIGQAGRSIKPRLLFSFGVSGAIQHTAAIQGADFIIAVNKNPDAAMMKMADIAIAADANQVCAAFIRELKSRIR